MIRAQVKVKGSVVFRQKAATWHFLWWEDGHRRSQRLGSIRDLKTREDAEKKAGPLRRLLNKDVEVVPVIEDLVEQYRKEKMPQRCSTKRGYEAWLDNHILPQWRGRLLTDLQARPVELWLHSLSLSPKSKQHIRGLLSQLWDFAMWRGAVPLERNPMELVKVRGTGKRTRKPVSLAPEQFQALLQTVGDDLCWRTLLLMMVSFGLRISEALALKWSDVNWFDKTLRIERGIVKQIVDEVKTPYSFGQMVIADDLLDVLALWKQHTQFSAPEDWVFASPVKLGRLPLSYTFVWDTLSAAGKKVGIHISSHTFRHTHRSWLDSEGTPVGVQQKLMRHADIRTTMNVYGDAITRDIRQAHQKIVRLALHKM